MAAGPSDSPIRHPWIEEREWEMALDASRDADTDFSEHISKEMRVPRHISAIGRKPMADAEYEMRRDENDTVSSVVHGAASMHVPDRIMLAGGDAAAAAAHAGQPMEVAMEQEALTKHHPSYQPVVLKTPPATLTLADSQYPTVEQEAGTGALAARRQQQRAMAAIDETEADVGDTPRANRSTVPLSELLTPAEQELVLLRKQVQRLSTRLYIVEHDSEQRAFREWLLGACLVVYLGYKMLKHVSNGRMLQ